MTVNNLYNCSKHNVNVYCGTKLHHFTTLKFYGLTRTSILVKMYKILKHITYMKIYTYFLLWHKHELWAAWECELQRERDGKGDHGPLVAWQDLFPNSVLWNPRKHHTFLSTGRVYATDYAGHLTTQLSDTVHNRSFQRGVIPANQCIVSYNQAQTTGRKYVTIQNLKNKYPILTLTQTHWS